MLTAQKGGFKVNTEDIHSPEEVRPRDRSTPLAADLRATHIWFGPHSPIYEEKDTEFEYVHIFFPKHI